ncbi:hypothetical protein [Afifella sp. IM 167]|uniref:hypothetical protein n=1 Tax=Afifella sp. IM 167 TaxID=2033586 RepID=UPI001CCEE06B|nr:hypothetical protein [Afifella sp. IM 167]MBZ8131791.1 hypothetical protein [Afifella sp. IM 167]
MIFSLVEPLLLVALAATSAVALMLHFRLRRLDAYHADYQRILSETSRALDAAHDAVARLNGEGHNVAHLLGERIEEANGLLAIIDGKLGRSQPETVRRRTAGFDA